MRVSRGDADERRLRRLPDGTAGAELGVYALTVANAKAGDYGLKIGLAWWVIGILLATEYFAFVYRSFAGKVDVGEDSHT